MVCPVTPDPNSRHPRIDRRPKDSDDREAELRDEIRRGYWDPPAEFDDQGPDGHGWAPDPYPGGGLV